MSAALGAVYGLLVLCGAVWLTLYVTWLFRVRLRHGDRSARSFRLWLRDLTDVIFGLG